MELISKESFVCPTCGGKGKVPIKEYESGCSYILRVCPTCTGTGHVDDPHKDNLD